jgi:thioredoxin-like negative regulator of GroEL
MKYKIILIIYLIFLGCNNSQNKSQISSISNLKELGLILENSKDSLICFDIYAQGCSPCRIISPTIEKLSLDNKDKVKFYKIDINHVPEVRNIFSTQHIPHIVFVKNKSIIASLIGIQPLESYQKIINQNK